MSKIRVQQPIVHTPSFDRWSVHRSYILEVVRQLGLEPLYPCVHSWYTYTDQEGCAKLLPNLLLKSSLYKTDVFTCINYAFRVWNEVSRLYELNTWVPVIGHIPNYSVRHAWILVMLGGVMGLKVDQFLYFEPNDGWAMGPELENAYQAFPLGNEGYAGELIFL